jgi:hypothetical protein
MNILTFQNEANMKKKLIRNFFIFTLIGLSLIGTIETAAAHSCLYNCLFHGINRVTVPGHWSAIGCSKPYTTCKC